MQFGTKSIGLIIFLAFMVPVAILSFKIKNTHEKQSAGYADEEESRRKIRQYFKIQGLLVLGLILSMFLFSFALRLIESHHK